jgi:hypothetical protein
MTVESAQTTQAPGERRFTRVLILLIVIETFVTLETTMAFAAVPTFLRVFDADAAAVGWITTAYLLVGAGVAATAGRRGDRREPGDPQHRGGHGRVGDLGDPVGFDRARHDPADSGGAVGGVHVHRRHRSAGPAAGLAHRRPPGAGPGSGIGTRTGAGG